jgi:Ca-activated chloride channel family protein
MHSTPARAGWGASLLIAAGLALSPQSFAAPRDAQHSRGPVFRAGVDLIVLHVTVTDPQRRLVAGLESASFLVSEEGIRQDVSFFASTRVPLDVAIALDTSGSMGESLPMAQKAAIGLVEMLEEGDRATVLQVHSRANVLHPLSGDTAAAVQAIRGVESHGATALYNSAYVAITQMNRSSRADEEIRRRTIVLLTDGRDTHSLVQFEDLLQLAAESDVAVYVILLSPRRTLASPPGLPESGGPERLMRMLAEVTGGRAFTPASAGDLPGIYRSIGHELKANYTLGYVSTDVRQDGTFRRVRVQVPGRPDLLVRARSGYRARARARARG